MQLTVRDVAQMLKVSESDVYRWASDHDLPAKQVNGQYRFNRAEVLEWATVRKMKISPLLFQATNGNSDGPPGLHDALSRGGILTSLPGSDRESVLRSAVAALPLPASCDRDFLLQVLLSRESMGSTEIGDGIAVPHPRFPVVEPDAKPFITLAFLEKPIRYSEGSTNEVNTLFVLVSPTIRDHLGLLARLASGLRDPSFLDAVRRREPAERILEQARRLDDSLRAGATNICNGTKEAK